MNRALLVAALLALLPVSRPAAAAPVAVSGAPVTGMADLGSLRAEVHKAEAAVAPLYDRRNAVATTASNLANQINALKAQPAGVRRDAELQRVLAESQVKTSELERVQAELRWREPGISELRHRLVRAIDGVLEHDAQKRLSDAQRIDLEQLRTATVALLVSPAAPLQIARDHSTVAMDPLDGPRELRYKADLLRDSGDKLRREASRIATRIDSVERRRHLRERAGSLDDDMFGEATSNRRVARTSGALTQHGNDKSAETTNAASDAANPSPPPQGGPASPMSPSVPGTGGNGVVGGTAPNTPVTTPSNGGMNNGGSTSNNGGSFSNRSSSESTVLRNLVDPKTLDELRRADEIDDVDRQTKALRRAQSELESLAKELDRRAKALEGRATELRNQK